jgi:SynChlorMet cassette radical SAM/SPASM protein ScmF
MEAVAALAREMGAGSVKFIIVQPTERGLRLHEHDQTMSIGELVETGRWVEEEFAGKAGLPVHFSHPPAFSPLERLVERVARCRIHNIIGVLADGSYALCGIGTSVPELCFGHASTDRMEDVWNDTPILSAIRKELPSRLGGICGRCLVRGACLGSCIAQNYYRCGDLFSGHWYCEMAYEAGLFPEERLSPPSVASGVERSTYH